MRFKKGGLKMNIFIKEMKSYRKSLILWSIGLLFMVYGGMGKFAGATASGQSMNDIIKDMPNSVKTVFGIGDFDLSKASGYYGMLFSYIAIMVTIHAVMLGANIISKEERDKTTEFLFVKPASRNSIVTSKLLAAFVNIVLINVITCVLSLSVVGYFAKGEAVEAMIVRLMLGLFVLQLIFIAIGIATAVFTRNPKTAASKSSAILLLTFLLAKAVDLNESFDALKYFTPFKYFEAKNLMTGFNISFVYVLLSILLIVLPIIATYKHFDKKDLNI
jgi:ABC-2 type transport system permease protein